jgi:AcrR family transcriptional regulator
MKAEDPEAAAPRTRESRRNDTRNLIFEAAIAEISKRGLSGVRIEHIARKASVTRPTVYAHFPKKEDFLRELEERSQGFTLRMLQERLNGVTGPDIFHCLADALFDLLDASEPTLRREVFALLVREPAKADWTATPFFGFLTIQLGAIQTRDGTAAIAEPAELTKIFMTALFGFLAIEGDEADTQRRAAHRMVDLLIG